MAALLCVCLPEYCGFSVSLSRDVFQDNHLSETFERRQHRETARGRPIAFHYVVSVNWGWLRRCDFAFRRTG